LAQRRGGHPSKRESGRELMHQASLKGHLPWNQ
jgi:hypothetical protein